MANVQWQFGPPSFYVKVSAQNGTDNEISGDRAVDEMNISFMTAAPITSGSASTTGGSASTSATPAAVTALPANAHAPLNPNATPIITTPLVPGTVIFNVLPIEITASFCFAEDDGFVDAWWHVSREGLRGKGTGKGLGKSTTVVPSVP